MKPTLVPGDVVRREDTGETVCVRDVFRQAGFWVVRVFWWVHGQTREDVLSPEGLTLIREARHE